MRLQAGLIATLCFSTLFSGCASDPATTHQAAKVAWASGGALTPNRRPVKVMIVTLFGPEANPWTSQLKFTSDTAVPGLSPDFPVVKCTDDDVCLFTTGMAHTNAAASTMAVIFSGQFDLTSTYFLVTGIAGIDPNVGTIGSATWARYLVDFGLAHEFDAREMPLGWKAGYFGLRVKDPYTKPPPDYTTQVFQLNESLLQKALTLTSGVTLYDNATAKAYRALYSQPSAQAPPAVIQCDTAAGDTYWHGNLIGQWATQFTSLQTDGKGKYCTSQQEDNAIYEAIKRGQAAGLTNTNRMAVLRTAANFDRPHPGQSAYESLILSNSGGFDAATRNIFIVANPLVADIVVHWSQWKDGVPP